MEVDYVVLPNYTNFLVVEKIRIERLFPEMSSLQLS